MSIEDLCADNVKRKRSFMTPFHVCKACGAPYEKIEVDPQVWDETGYLIDEGMTDWNPMCECWAKALQDAIYDLSPTHVPFSQGCLDKKTKGR